MPTDAGDVAGIAGSTLSGAAAGSAILPGVGTVVGGAIGFVTGLFSNSAESKREAMEAAQIARERKAAGLEGEARELQLMLNAFDADRARKQYVSNAIAAGEAVTAAATMTNLKGSSVAALAQSTLLQQTASALQHSIFTQRAGEQITAVHQAAVDARLGIGDSGKAAPPVLEATPPPTGKYQGDTTGTRFTETTQPSPGTYQGDTTGTRFTETTTPSPTKQTQQQLMGGSG